MIIQIRGTSGSGKTTVMREVMKKFEPWKPMFVERRKKPLYYRHGELVVVGHYEIDCGGCDTIGSAPKVFDVIQSLKFDIALSEGLLWSEDVKWTLRLEDVRAFFLATDADECLRRVVNRQAGREPADAVRVKRKLITRIGTIERARLRLVAAGVCCKRVGSTQAAKAIVSTIRREIKNG